MSLTDDAIQEVNRLFLENQELRAQRDEWRRQNGILRGELEQACAELASIGPTETEWGVQNNISGRVFTTRSKAVAQDLAAAYGRTFPTQPHRAVTRRIGPWREIQEADRG